MTLLDLFKDMPLPYVFSLFSVSPIFILKPKESYSLHLAKRIPVFFRTKIVSR